MNNMMPDWAQEVLSDSLVIDAQGVAVPAAARQAPADAGTAFHQLMPRGTTLRTLERQELHLAYWETPYYRAAIGRMLERAPGRALAVDIGCGDGRFIRDYLDAGFRHVLAVDSNRSSLTALAEHVRDEGLADRVLPVLASAAELPVRDGVADCALAIGCLYYLNDMFGQGLSEAVRILKADAPLINSEPDMAGAALKAMFFGDVEDFLTVVETATFSETHDGSHHRFRCFTPEMLEVELGKYGMRVVDRHFLSIFPSLVRIAMVRRSVSADELRTKLDRVRAAFDGMDGTAGAAKHVIWCSTRAAAG